MVIAFLCIPVVVSAETTGEPSAPYIPSNTWKPDIAARVPADGPILVVFRPDGEPPRDAAVEIEVRIGGEIVPGSLQLRRFDDSIEALFIPESPFIDRGLYTSPPDRVNAKVVVTIEEASREFEVSIRAEDLPDRVDAALDVEPKLTYFLLGLVCCETHPDDISCRSDYEEFYNSPNRCEACFPQFAFEELHLERRFIEFPIRSEFRDYFQRRLMTYDEHQDEVPAQRLQCPGSSLAGCERNWIEWPSSSSRACVFYQLRNVVTGEVFRTEDVCVDAHDAEPDTLTLNLLKQNTDRCLDQSVNRIWTSDAALPPEEPSCSTTTTPTTLFPTALLLLFGLSGRRRQSNCAKRKITRQRRR